MAQERQGDPILGYYFRDLFLMGQTDAARLYLIRHAQSEGNTGATSDFRDPPLTQVGREQSRRLAQRLARQGIDVIYSSPLRRAQETAQDVAQAAGLSLQTLEGLQEVGVGVVGEPLQVSPEQARAVKERILRQGSWDAFPDSEGSVAIRQRVVQALDSIVAQCSGQRVAVITHAGVIQTYVSHVLGLERDFVFYPFNASITSIRALGDRRVIWRLNDVAHLDGLPPGFEGIS